MTATDDRPAVTRPDRCQQHECTGEHWHEPTYLPASGREPYVVH